MTTQYAIISTVSGQASLAAKLFAVNGDTVLYTADSVTERTNAKGQYLSTFGEVSVIPAGAYMLTLFTAGGLPVAIGQRTFVGTDAEVATETPGTAVLDSSAQTQIDKIEASTCGTVTGAGTSTEVFVGPSATLTITVDASGNRSSVVVT